MNGFTFAMAFVMGLTGSLHCAGMCGPIMLVMPFNHISGIKKWMGILLYHLGRISVYALLAIVLHSFRSMFAPQIQQIISITLGGFLLLIGLLSFMPSKFRIALPWTTFVKKRIGRFIGHPSIGALFITGMLNGLLPCGLVYMALAASLAGSNLIHTAGMMYAFGFGTVPMLIGFTVLKNKAGFFRFNAKKWVPALMFVFGSLFVLRGLNLGIPYLSPKLEVTHQEIKASCCHKK
jgi:hypothetical protein